MTQTQKLITVEAHNALLDSIQRELADARVDINIKDDRIRELEKLLREARFENHELEIGTQTMRTLALEVDEKDFDPRATGEFRTDRWGTAK